MHQPKLIFQGLISTTSDDRTFVFYDIHNMWETKITYTEYGIKRVYEREKDIAIEVLAE